METQSNKVILISLCSLCFILSVALSACHTTDKGERRICCIPTKPLPSGRLTVYGKVHNIAVKDSSHKRVHGKDILFKPYSYPCSDSTDSAKVIKKSIGLWSIK
jgi:hypothetical protein